jgi:DivIVA domain-containing protein
MSATNLDLPVLVSAEQIRRREFVTIRRGYDPDQVRDYLTQLADQVELMRVMLRDARAEADAAIRANAQPRVDPYEQLGARISSVIREADESAERIRRDARIDAERMTIEARTEADRIRTDAQARAEEARSQAEAAVRAARDEADRTIAGLATRRDALVDQLAGMQSRLLGVARDLEAVVDGDGQEALAGPESSTPAQDDERVFRTIVVSEAMEPGPVVPQATEPEEPGPSLMDPSYEELWEGQEMRIEIPEMPEIPEIPSLDLDWGDDGSDDPLI